MEQEELNKKVEYLFGAVVFVKCEEDCDLIYNFNHKVWKRSVIY